jgi:hypothetical protein
MKSSDEPYSYPVPDVQVLPFGRAFHGPYPKPPGLITDRWPPLQVEYLRVYLEEIGCKTVVVEHHYIDRVFMHDNAVFYVRNLRSYPNFTTRLHFFADEFNQDMWRAMITRAANGAHAEIQATLQKNYRGFSVVRPIPGAPVGRTVLPASVTRAPADSASAFAPVRRHTTHLAGFSLVTEGVPFQQQDHAVSACATTALWSALDSVASVEEMPVASPANIAEAATRYPLQEGRAFPTEGLTVRQICEATRSAGFSPIVITGKNPKDDYLQIFGYLTSGFAPVLVLIPADDPESASGHAVCAVGVRRGEVKPQTDPNYKFREESTSLLGLYTHDDRLGPYAFADLSPFTDRKTSAIRTGVSIKWPDQTPGQYWLLHAFVVPVPQKLRLSLTRIRRIGLIVAQTIGDAFGEPTTTLNCRYELARKYGERAYEFGLSNDGIYKLACQTPMSRFLGIVEVRNASGPIIDVLLDTTEADAEPAVLACVTRNGMPAGGAAVLDAIAKHIGGQPIS